MIYQMIRMPFVQRGGYSFKLDLDDAVFKLIVALGNPEINEALKNNDFEKFMNLCADMNLLKDTQTTKLKLIFQSEEEQKIFDAIATQMNGTFVETRGVAAYVIVSIVIIIAIVISIAEISAIDEPEVPLSMKSTDDANKMLNIQNQYTSSFLRYPNFAVLDVWALKNKEVDSFQLLLGYKNFMAEQIFAFLQKNKPEVFENFSESQVLEFLKRNLIV